MQAQFMPMPNEAPDDARRQELVSRFFYLAGDLLAGSDNAQRFDRGEVGGPLLGPRTNSPDVQVGDGGAVFQRGSARQVGQATATPAQSGAAGLSLPVLLIIGAVLYAVTR